MIAELKVCRSCGGEKPVSEFFTRRRKDRLYVEGTCKDCTRLRLRNADRARRLARREERERNMVPVEPFRRRLVQMEDLYALERRTWPFGDEYKPEEMGPTGMVAVRMGWVVRRKGLEALRPDTTRVKRVVGLKRGTDTLKRGRRYPGSFREFIPYDLAVRLCRAMDADPVDMGV